MNATALSDLQKVTMEHEKLINVHSTLEIAYSELKSMHDAGKARAEIVEANLQSNESHLQQLHDEYKNQMDAAAELAEKQNSLTMALEAKV